MSNTARKLVNFSQEKELTENYGFNYQQED